MKSSSTAPAALGQAYPGTSCGDAPLNSYFGPVIKHNGQFVKTDGYCTDEFFGRAIQWMDSARTKEKPFFTWIATNAPHGPLDITEEYEALYKGKVPENVAKFFGMIANIDDNIGKLRAFLAREAPRRQYAHHFHERQRRDRGRSHPQCRYARGESHAVGRRHPRSFILAMEEHTDAGRCCGADGAHRRLPHAGGDRRCHSLSDAVKQQVEGRSLVPLLKNPQAKWDDRFLFTQTGRWDVKTNGRQAKRENAAVRWRSYTLVATPKETKGEWQLFNLATDPGQMTDIAAANPDIVQKLSEAYDEWWDSLPPYLVNEQLTGPKWNPFHEQYWKQYRGPGPNNAPVPAGFVLP